MKVLLWIAAAVLALFSALHVFVTHEHWHQVDRRRYAVARLASFVAACAVIAGVRVQSPFTRRWI